MSYGRITGWGTNLPDRVLTNDDLSRIVDTSDEWITARSGIRSRHVDGKVTEMSAIAGRAAMDMAGVDPDRLTCSCWQPRPQISSSRQAPRSSSTNWASPVVPST